jgi:hypothetical protein
MMPLLVQRSIAKSLGGAIIVLASTAAAQTTQPAHPEPPPLRKHQEVQRVLDAAQTKFDTGKLRVLRVVLIAGPKDHGKGEHDYPAWQKQWTPLLAKAPKVVVTTAFGKPAADVWESADLMVFYCWGPQFWDDQSYALADRFLARGGGMAVLHSAVISTDQPQKLADRIGFGYTPQIRYRHGPQDLTFVGDDPITAGLKSLHVVDEDYWPPQGTPSYVRTLATCREDGRDYPIVWSCQRGKGRCFSTILGHYTWTLDDPLVRIIILRGMAWSAGEPINRFQQLATDSVKLAGE